MTGSITVTGMILSAGPMGEYDRRLVFLTKEKGKISAFAKGVRRPTATMSGLCQPFVFGRFTLYEGRNSYTLQSAEAENYFAELRENLETVYYGVYFCEFAEAITREGLPAKEELKVLYRSLGALSKKSIGAELVRAIFELKMLSVSGVSPQVFECVKCRKKENLRWFTAEGGGCVCDSCRERLHVESISGSTLYTMQYILATPIESLYTFTVSEEVLWELKRVIKQFLAVHMDRKFKSLEMLEEL